MDHLGENPEPLVLTPGGSKFTETTLLANSWNKTHQDHVVIILKAGGNGDRSVPTKDKMQENHFTWKIVEKQGETLLQLQNGLWQYFVEGETRYFMNCGGNKAKIVPYDGIPKERDENRLDKKG